MLKSLKIKNYAIIDELSIDLDKHFNVFTGETGAGKSIIIGALSLLSKGKSDSSIVKTGEEKAIIEGIFSIGENDEYLKSQLDEALIDYDDELIVKRVISKDGKNQIRINDSTVTLSFLNKLFDPIIDVHSQKDNQYLLIKKNHQFLLDKYADDSVCLNEYKEKYNEFKNLENEYNSLLNETYNENDLEYLNFQLKELTDANLDAFEEEDLLNKEKNYKLAEKYLTNLTNAINLYNGNDGIKEKLYSLIKEIDINDEKLAIEKQAIESLYYDLDEHLDNIEKFYANFEEGNINIEKVEERLFIYSKLKRKYSKNVIELIEYINEINERINFYKDRDVILKQKQEKLQSLKSEVLNLGKKLSEIRKNAALKLEKEVDKESNDLLLNNVVFKVNFEDNEISSDGIDNIEFYISLNKGEEPKPLRNVASGGEMSRILLSLKIIFAKLSNTKLIVFDEIDSGVSGKAALAIGQKIALIAKDIQVITITHLAPVAACGSKHFYIYKDSNEDITKSHIKTLNEQEIYQELALISSGQNNDSSLEAAKSLYNLAQESVK